MADQGKKRNAEESHRRWSGLKGLAVGGGSALLIALLTFVVVPGFFQGFENGLYDMRVRFDNGMTVPLDPDTGIYIVRIDDRSLENYGRFAQWPRSRHGALARRMGAWQAAAVFFDLVFTQEDVDPRQDEQMARGFADAGVVYSAISLTDKESYYFESSIPSSGIEQNSPRSVIPVSAIPGSETLPDFSETKIVEGPSDRISRASLGLALANVFADKDGVIRRQPLLLRWGDLVLPTTAFRLFMDLTGVNSDALSLEPGRFLHAGPFNIPVDAQCQFLIHWYPEDGPFRELPYWDLAERPDSQLPTEAFAGSVFLVGPTAAALEDMKATSAGLAVPGVQVHATLLANLAMGDRVGTMGYGTGVLLTVLLGALAGLFALKFRTSVGALSTAAMFLVLVVASFYVFVNHDFWMELFRPALGIVIAYTGTMTFRYVTEERQKRVIKGAFQQYVPPTVVEEMLLNPEKLALGGERRELSILFADIQGFTTFSESLEPEALTNFLNRFLTVMTNRIFAAQGTIDKYIGDAIMAIFGAPLWFEDHPTRALNAALDMRGELAHIRQEWGSFLPETFDLKLGINSGPVVVGNMGSEMRFDYTVIGDNVNLAARLEALTRQYGAGLLISESTRDAAGDAFLVRELDLVRVKGKNHPVRIFDVHGHTGAPEDTPELQHRISAFTDALGDYRAQAWDRALEQFTALEGDPAAGVFADRCRHLKDEPPGADWDGVWVMKTK